MAVRKPGKTNKELLTGQIAAAMGAGREVVVETVDFSDLNRPKTYLEVDFPIILINQIAGIEGNAGKPIYQISKWWARRRSTAFRTNPSLIHRRFDRDHRSGYQDYGVESSGNRQTAPRLHRRSGLPNRKLIVNRFAVIVKPRGKGEKPDDLR